MKKYITEDLIKILISSVFLVLSQIYSNKILLIGAYIIIAYEMYIESWKHLKEGELFDENFLMIIATIGAFIIDNSLEAVLVILLFQIGEYLEDLAVSKSEESITKLMDLRVEEIELEEKGRVSIKEAKEGDIFLVKPGERIPLDGIIIKGESYLDTSCLTGESTPQKVKVKDSVLSGSINREGLLKIKATSTANTSTVQKILDLVKQAEEEKTQTETFIHRFAKVYTPIICTIALIMIIIPWMIGDNLNTWIYRALIFLVTSCPCALVISVPLGYFCGIGKCAKEGIIIKGSKELENLWDCKYIILDKTGTITEGVFEVTKVESKIKEDDFLKIVASAEQLSIHPISKAIKEKYSKKLEEVSNYQEISGKGIHCTIQKKDILIGNEKLLEENHISFDKVEDIGTIIYVAINKEYQGYLRISDRIRKSSKVLEELLQEKVILSGDNTNIVKEIAKKCKISTSFGDLLPEDKVKIVKEYKQTGKTIFIGDGMNDAAVLKVADVGISMGSIGSDAAIEASDIILMNDDLSKVKTALGISKLTKRKVIESIIFALAVKIVVLIGSIIGYGTILLAVFADVGVTLLAILNVLTIFLKK